LAQGKLANQLDRRMYIDLVPNRGSKAAILLRESIREGKRIRERTIANLSALTLEQAEAIRSKVE
jgi:hypothetical protein